MQHPKGFREPHPALGPPLDGAAGCPPPHPPEQAIPCFQCTATLSYVTRSMVAPRPFATVTTWAGRRRLFGPIGDLGGGGGADKFGCIPKPPGCHRCHAGVEPGGVGVAGEVELGEQVRAAPGLRSPVLGDPETLGIGWAMCGTSPTQRMRNHGLRADTNDEGQMTHTNPVQNMCKSQHVPTCILYYSLGSFFLPWI